MKSSLVLLEQKSGEVHVIRIVTFGLSGSGVSATNLSAGFFPALSAA
jgi:hypothetical protein